MNCDWIRLGLVADEPGERAAFETHAAACPDCAKLLVDDRALAAEVERYRSRSPEPPDRLAERITASIAAERRGRAAAPAPRRRAWAVYATAAALLAVAVAASVLYRGSRTVPSEDEVGQAIRQADQAERDYAAAIARLESQSQAILAAASDPSTNARRAAILFALRDRLNHIDAVIADTREFLRDNPGNAQGHSILLSAYREKSDVLREVVALPPGDRS